MRVSKRVVDLLFSISLMPLLCLICIPVVIINVIYLKYPFFTQPRVGKNEVTFKIFKLRTMDISGHVNGFNRFIRLVGIDELPQLFNIIKGDMSIVGPRPVLVKYLPVMSVAEKVRFRVKPGITGLAQISGRNRLTWDDKFKLDLHYVAHYSALLDLKIVLNTFKVLSTMRDAPAKDLTEIRLKNE